MERIDARLDRASDRPIAVAFSGGGDSLALLCATVGYARQAGRRVVAITIDHQLSPESPLWTQHAKLNAETLGAHWRGRAWTGDKPMTGLPAAARYARHKLVADVARQEGAQVVLFGHTADDVSEALDMRATDTPGLSAPKTWGPSPAWPEGRGLAIFRPMLPVRRETLRAALRTQGLTWVDDPANIDPRFARSRARQRLAASESFTDFGDEPINPELSEFAGGVDFTEWGDARVDLDALVKVPPSVGQRALSMLVTCVSGAERLPHQARVVTLLKRLSDTRTVTATLGGALILAEGKVLRVVREAWDDRHIRRRAENVFDGRFESNAVQHLQWLKGQMRHLAAEDRVRLREVHPVLRPSLPVWCDGAGTVYLAGCHGERGPTLRSLAKERFRLACGLAQRESELNAL